MVVEAEETLCLGVETIGVLFLQLSEAGQDTCRFNSIVILEKKKKKKKHYIHKVEFRHN